MGQPKRGYHTLRIIFSEKIIIIIINTCQNTAYQNFACHFKGNQCRDANGLDGLAIKSSSIMSEINDELASQFPPKIDVLIPDVFYKVNYL